MLDEKTTEPQQEMPSAPKPTAQRGEKLRSLWARLQCVHLLRRHRFRRKTQHHMNNVSQKMRATPMVQTVGEGLYALGFSTEYAVVRAGRRVRAAALWVAAWFAALAHDLMGSRRSPVQHRCSRICLAPSSSLCGAAGRCWFMPTGFIRKKALARPCRPVYISSQTVSGAM